MEEGWVCCYCVCFILLTNILNTIPALFVGKLYLPLHSRKCVHLCLLCVHYGGEKAEGVQFQIVNVY